MQNIIFGNKKCQDICVSVAKSLNSKLYLVENSGFPGNEVFFDINSNNFGDNNFAISTHKDLRNYNIICIYTVLDANNDFMELLFLIDILAKLNPLKITLLIPYLAYSRQDNNHNMSSSGIKLIAKILNHVLNNIENQIYILDTHNTNILKMFHNAQNLCIINFLHQYILAHYNTEELILVSPDSGSQNKIKTLAELLSCRALYLNKTRKLNDIQMAFDGSQNNNINKLCGDKKRKTKFLILDDIISSGSTIYHASKLIRNQILNADIDCYATHFLYFAVQSNNFININRVITTNSTGSHNSIHLQNIFKTHFSILDISSLFLI